MEKYGSELLAAPGILRTMVLGIIPTEYEDELLAKPHIKTWQEIVQWCKIKTVYKRQKLLAEAARKSGGSIRSLIIEEVDEQGQIVEGSKSTEEEQPPSWFMDYVNKLGDKKPPPPPKPTGDGRRQGQRDDKKTKLRFSFEGCWHCGQREVPSLVLLAVAGGQTQELHLHPA